MFVDFVEVGGVASEAELSQGDVIRSIEGRSVNTLEDLKGVVESFEDHDMLLLQVQRGNVDRLVLFELKDEAEEGDGS